MVGCWRERERERQSFPLVYTSPLPGKRIALQLNSIADDGKGTINNEGRYVWFVSTVSKKEWCIVYMHSCCVCNADRKSRSNTFLPGPRCGGVGFGRNYGHIWRVRLSCGLYIRIFYIRMSSSKSLNRQISSELTAAQTQNRPKAKST
jgi:hypothetical protein